MRTHLFVLLVAGLAGCATVAPGVTELADVQALRAAGNYAAIADRRVGCRIGQEGCRQVREITGDACLRLAQEALVAANAAGAAPRAACAAAQYRAVLDSGQGDRQSLELRELEALRLQRETARSTADAATAND